MTRWQRRRSARTARWLLVASLLGSSVHAQTPDRRTRRVPAPSLSGNSLRTHLGIDVAEARLKDQDPEQRQRGLERLGSIGTAQALDVLLKAFETGGAARTAKDRLVAVRALSAHAKVPAVREFLVRVMVGVGSNPGRSEAIDAMIERAAALSLAAVGDDASLSALGKALRQSGHVADTASDALLAFPPRNLEPIVLGSRSPTRALASFLGQLGDPRAIPGLREIVRSAPSDVRPVAALALAHLGVAETIPLARHWLAHERGLEFRGAATRILVEFRTPDAAPAVAGLLGDPQSRALALELAEKSSLPALGAALIRSTKGATADERSALFNALALAGTREAFSFLGGALGTRETSSAAALALALSPRAEAEAQLEQALRAPATRRPAVRASLARRVALDSEPSGLRAALDELAASHDESDRALFVEASALLDPSRTAALAKRATDSELRALSRVAWLPEVSRALAEQLANEADSGRREALAACLVFTEAAEQVPSNVLLDLLDARGLAAPLAARALAARDSHTLRPKIVALLESDDALLRVHAALGLGLSQDSSALGVLERAYRFETDASVRLALVHALAARREPARLRALQLARKLDASAQVRESAALALAGAKPAPESSGRQSAWLELAWAEGAPQDERSARGTRVITSSGLALPAFADPDGVLLLPALPSGPFELRLAAPTRTDDAPPPKHP